jgi:glycosyltransferase involved in cell wall biosynthesis
MSYRAKIGSSGRLRIVVFARRFWPFSGLGELAVGELASRLRKRGHDVSIATVRWTRSWTERLDYREMPVVRIAAPIAGRWSAGRFARSFARFFSSHRPIDGVIFSGMSEEVQAAISAVPRGVPTVLRIDESFEGVTHSIHRRHVELGLLATSVVATWPTIAKRLAEIEEFPKTTVIHDAVDDLSVTRTVAGQSTARMSLSEAHPIMNVLADQPLVVTGSRLNGDPGVFDLITAWKTVVRYFPEAKLWVLGDGLQANTIWKQIVREELAQSVIMPGFFDDLTEILAAADLYVHPGRTDLPCSCLPRAMAAGLAPVTTLHEWCSWIQSGRNGLIVPPQNPGAMAEALIHGLTQRELRDSWGATAQQTARARFPAQLVIDSYERLLSSGVDQQVEVAT